ncbi:MAG: restriction endonuclease subunit S [Alphaproteobacteria bacterium]|nr:restriction endonuclease subunit S [Alphaproteobacteria bacterium]
MNKNSLKPSIRFKGFADAWEQRKLGEVYKVTRGYVLASTETSDKKNAENPYPVYSSQTKDNGLMGYFKNYLYSDAITWTTDGVNAGTVRFRKGKFYCTNVCGVLLSDEGVANKMTAEALNKIAWRYVSKVGNPKLMNNIMAQIEFKLPISLKEQTKISQFFDSLDDLITLHQRKLDKLSNIKKALLEKMFPKNGSDTPEIRFKGFTDAWEQRKLGEYANITTGKLDANAMNPDGQYDFYTSGIQKYKIDYPAFRGPAITIAGNGATVGYMHIADGEFNAYQRTYVLTEFKTNREFLYFQIGQKLPQKIALEARTGSIPYIVLDMLTDLEIQTPKEIECIKIGTFFSDLDNLITLHQRKLDKLNNIKKACLEKMFV